MMQPRKKRSDVPRGLRWRALLPYSALLFIAILDEPGVIDLFAGDTLSLEDCIHPSLIIPFNIRFSSVICDSSTIDPVLGFESPDS